jgi:hypothetical protein
MECMEAIATYTERHPQVARTFKLFPDRVEIHAQWLVKSYDSTVPLASLKPAHREITVRNRHYKTAKMVFGLGLVLIAMAVYNHRPGQPLGSPLMFGGVVIMSAAIALMVRTYGKVVFARFNNQEDKPGLDIARIGPDKQRFDEFVAQVQKQIRAARR